MFDSITSLSDFFFDPDRISFAILAMLLCMVVGMITGPLANNINPLSWIVFDMVFGRIGSRLDRSTRMTADLVLRGMILTFVSLFLIYVLGLQMVKLVATQPFYGLTEVVLLSLTMTGGSVWYSLLKLYFALGKNAVSKGSYLTIARSTRNDLNTSDNFGVTRVGMGMSAMVISRGLIGPVLWYFIAGLPGAYIYALLAMLSWRFGKEGFTKGFGRLPLALERLLGFIPDMLAGTLISMAGLFTPTGTMTKALLAQMFGRKQAKYDQGGKGITALAFALKVSLGGPISDLDGSVIKRDWIGPDGATAKLEAGHLKRAIYINFVTYILFMASLVSAILWSGILPG